MSLRQFWWYTESGRPVLYRSGVTKALDFCVCGHACWIRWHYEPCCRCRPTTMGMKCEVCAVRKEDQ